MTFHLLFRRQAEKMKMNRECEIDFDKDLNVIRKFVAVCHWNISVGSSCLEEKVSEIFRQECWKNLTLGKIMTWDETWVLQYDPEIIYQWRSCESLRLRKTWMSKLNLKAMLIYLFTSKKLLIMNLFLKTSEPSILFSCFRIFTACLWPDKWILHHNNPSSHTDLWKISFQPESKC